MLYGIAVVSNDMFIGRDSSQSPVEWASPEDQAFYLGKIIETRPIGIMGRGTYNEIKGVAKKSSIYSSLNVVVLDHGFDYDGKKFCTCLLYTSPSPRDH
jgi:dihydrofolate reductase